MDDRTDAADPADVSASSDANAEEGDDVEALRSELEQAKDRSLRLQAELENFRARTRREMEEERRFAALPLIRDLLPALDNVARAIDAAEKEGDTAGLLDGFKMVAEQLASILARHDCRRIDALHQPFDPHLHEAITQQPSQDHPPGTVLLVAQEGYELAGRVVRPAQVIVSVAPPSE
ncbi:MAG: nucleotide exchange factor GrpE [Pirellulales bacterium]|nr:nucleotide exchange factor GrpE [Planctomycetales bacterium]